MGQRTSRLETSAGAVVFCRRDPSPVFLLILDGHGNWGFPKGHIEPGEGRVETAIREVREETAVVGVTNHGEIGSREWEFFLAGDPVTKICHFFLFEATDLNAVPQVDEGISELEWLDVTNAASRLTFQSSRSVLAEAHTRLIDLPRRADRVC